MDKTAAHEASSILIFQNVSTLTERCLFFISIAIYFFMFTNKILFQLLQISLCWCIISSLLLISHPFCLSDTHTSLLVKTPTGVSLIGRPSIPLAAPCWLTASALPLLPPAPGNIAIHTATALYIAQSTRLQALKKSCLSDSGLLSVKINSALK